MSRISFTYTLLDQRHEAFASGKRKELLTPIDWFLFPGFIQALGLVSLGVFFLGMGLRGLLYEFAVRNDWVLTEAAIVAVVPVQSGAQFNWHYLYTFETTDGRSTTGTIVEDDNQAFEIGERVPVRYLRSDPVENSYALDKMPKRVLYWFLMGLGGVWVYFTAGPLFRHVAAYLALRRFARRGQAVPGVLMAVHYPPENSNRITARVEYTFTTPDGKPRRESTEIPLRYLTGDPPTGTAVAVWWAQDYAPHLL